MSGYTVTITPSGGQSGAQTTIQVDTTSGAARVTELTVKAGGLGLTPQDLPVIDLAGLVAALAPASVPVLTAAPAAPAQPARRGRGRKVAEAPKKTTRGRRAAAPEAPAKAGRAYRRMPDQEQVVAVYKENPSASVMATHFGVPRHTANGWIRRLKKLGAV